MNVSPPEVRPGLEPETRDAGVQGIPSDEWSGPGAGAGVKAIWLAGGLTRLYAGLFGASAMLLMSGGLLMYVVKREPVQVERIEVTGATYLGPEEVVAISGIEVGRTYDGAALDAAAERLELHTAVLGAELDASSDGTVTIQLEERSCVAIVQVDTEPGVLFEVDPDLVILSENRVRCAGLPLVRGQFHKEFDRFLDPDLAGMVNALETLRDNYPRLAARISEMRMNRQGGVSLFMAPRRLRVEMPMHLSEEKLRQLYATMAYYEQSGSTSDFIDLRGDEAVFLGD